MIFIAVPFALVVGYLWLRGGWMTPVLLTLAYAVAGGLLALDDGHIKSFLAVLLFIWAPFMVRRVTGSRLPSIGGPYRVMAAVERR